MANKEDRDNPPLIPYGRHAILNLDASLRHRSVFSPLRNYGAISANWNRLFLAFSLGIRPHLPKQAPSKHFNANHQGVTRLVADLHRFNGALQYACDATHFHGA